MLDKAFNVLGLLVTAGIITTLVAHPHTKDVVNAFTNGFAADLRAATGQKSSGGY